MVLPEAAQQLVYLPDSFKEPLAIPAAVLVGAGAIVYDWYKSKKTTTEYAQDYRENAALMDQAVKDVQAENKGRKVVNSRWARLGTRVLLVAGITIGTGLIASQPSLAVGTPSHKTDVEFLLGSDEAETATYDVQGLSRFKAAKEALEESSFGGHFSLFEVNGTETPVLSNTSVNSASSKVIIKNLTAAPSTSVDLASSMDFDAGLLPTVGKTAKGLPKKSGELVVYSDGDITDSSTTLNAEAQKLRKEDVKVDIIVAGTSKNSVTGKDVTFDYDGTQGNVSDIQPNVFINAFGSSDVHVTDSVAGIAQQFNSASGNAEVFNYSNQPDFSTFIVPALLLGYGLRRQGKQVRGRVLITS